MICHYHPMRPGEFVNPPGVFSFFFDMARFILLIHVLPSFCPTRVFPSSVVFHCLPCNETGLPPPVIFHCFCAMRMAYPSSFVFCCLFLQRGILPSSSVFCYLTIWRGGLISPHSSSATFNKEVFIPPSPCWLLNASFSL